MADHVLYEVEALLAKKVLPSRRVLYLVRWKGFSSDYDSWEPYSNLKTCRPLITIFNRNSRESGPGTPPKQSMLLKTNVTEDGSDIKPHKHKKITKNILSLTKKKIQSHAFKAATGKAAFSKQKTKKFKFPIKFGTKALKAKKEDKLASHSKDSEKSSDVGTSSQTSGTNVYKPDGKGIKRRKHDTDDTNKSSNTTKIKKKKYLREKINETEKDLEDTRNVAVKTNDDNDDDDDDSDSDILYSLNPDCDIAKLDDVKVKDDNKTKKISAKVKNNTERSRSVISKQDSAAHPKSMIVNKNGVNKKKKMSLIDSKKPSKDWLTKSGVVQSGSPPPMFTSVKHLVISPDTQDPSKPLGNPHQDPVPPEASETYLADVPSSYPVPAEEPHTNKQLLSPRSLSYNSLLDSLPDQLLPSHRGSKKSNKSDSSSGDSSSGTSSALVSYSVGGEQVERRTSVRSTECAFRYKQIVVKKCVRYTQIWLNTQTAMKNALNPQVIQEVVSALNSAKYDDSHLVLFSSLGNVFCSGTDLHVLVSGDRRMSARQMADAIRELTKTFITFPKPIIAAVSGAAVGLGVSLLALCDIVYASDKASFHLPYSQLSQTPEGCSSYTLPLTLGLPSANELLYGGRKITAMEAYQLGLVSQVFWPTLMMQEVIPRAQNMATCSAKALEATKLLVRSHHRTKMELTNETECNLLLERWLSTDCQRAIEAYLSNEKNLTF